MGHGVSATYVWIENTHAYNSIKFYAIGYNLKISIEFNAHHFKYDTLSHFHVQHI